jgi:predicted oxidoreductase (fatty acid repression mutant protein)
MEYDYYLAREKRRSIYALSKESDISDQRIEEILEHSLKYTPTAFNSQSGRIVLLLGKEHDQLWDMIKEMLKEIVPENRFKKTNDKIESFKNGYGTVLFFEDQEVVESLQLNFPSYKKNFPLWSYQSSGMLQHAVWTSFAIEGLGASLQHYNEIIEEKVKSRWNIPVKWTMMSQMPFGKPYDKAGPKEFEKIDKRLKVFNS